MIDRIEHPDVIKAKEMIRPALEAIDKAIEPEVVRLRERVDQTTGETRDRYADELYLLLEDARRQREVVMKPVFDLANLYPTKLVFYRTGTV